MGKALLLARAGDELAVTKLDRLGRSLENPAFSKDLQARGVDLGVLDEGIDTSTPVGTLDELAAARARKRTRGQEPSEGF